MHIAICDDHPGDGARLAEIIADFAAEQRLNIRVSRFTDAEDMLSAARREAFTHYFLDIIMPGMDGIMAAQRIRAEGSEARLVFLSGSNEYAYQSYRVEAFDYLLKPAEPRQVRELLVRMLANEESDQDFICIQKGRGFMRLPVAQLSHLEVNQKQLYFYMVDGRVRQFAGTLAEYEQELLSRPEFVKIHRSYIVNLQQVSQLLPEGCVLLSGKSLPISRLLYNKVRQKYMSYLFGGREA